jgi:tetratricopeptide (TPR) repeat protein
MKATFTIVICLIGQFILAQAVDNYARNSKLRNEEEERFQNELKTNQDKAEVYWRHANVLAEFTFNAYKTAGEFYEKALSIDRSKVIYFIDYVNYLHLKLKDADKARKIYHKALKLFPDNEELQRGIDNLSKSQANSDSLKMRETLKETGMYRIAKSPLAQTMYAAGETLFKNGNYQKSISCYLKALELESDFVDAMDNLGNSYRYLNKFDSAEYWYNKSIKLYPDGYIAHQNLAIVYLSTSRLEKALAEYDLLIELDSKNPEGYFGKANTYIHLGNGKEVVAYAQEARERYRLNNDEYERDAVYLMGVGYYLQDNEREAKKYLLEARGMGVRIPEELSEILK